MWWNSFRKYNFKQKNHDHVFSRSILLFRGIVFTIVHKFILICLYIFLHNGWDGVKYILVFIRSLHSTLYTLHSTLYMRSLHSTSSPTLYIRFLHSTSGLYILQTFSFRTSLITTIKTQVDHPFMCIRRITTKFS